MIKVNLLLVKKRKKSKPLPMFLIGAIAATLALVVVWIVVRHSYVSDLEGKQKIVRENEEKIKELQKKIKAVEDFEKLNAVYKQRRDIIEQLGKNKTLPVKVIDRVSSLLADGVWLTYFELHGNSLSLNGTAFTNDAVVNFVNNLKESPQFTDVYLRESVQGKTSGVEIYNFKLTMKVTS